MTREEAIKIIGCYDIGFYDLSGEKIPAEKLVEAFDMAIESLQADAVQGAGRYEKAMQTLREMPKYLKGVKEKQIKKISADAVEVVRCKDCKFGVYEKGRGIYHTRCEILEFLFQDDDYCSYGERKDEE